jgi:hypothetical protein
VVMRIRVMSSGRAAAVAAIIPPSRSVRRAPRRASSRTCYGRDLRQPTASVSVRRFALKPRRHPVQRTGDVRMVFRRRLTAQEIANQTAPYTSSMPYEPTPRAL